MRLKLIACKALFRELSYVSALTDNMIDITWMRQGYHTEPELLFDVLPESFMPQPKVVSSVVRMRKRERPPVDTDERKFFKVVRAAFAQRRKTLVNSLSSSLGISKDGVTAAVEECGLDPLVRGEALDMDAFARLAEALGDSLR